MSLGPTLAPNATVTDPRAEGSPLSAPAIGLVGLLAFAGGWLQSFVFPLAPVVPWGDEALFLLDGVKIAAGQLPYRDFVQIVTPGADYFYAVLVLLFGPRTWLPGMTMAVLTAATAVAITIVSRRLLAGWLAALPALLFVGLVVPRAAYPTHHWFSTLAIIAAAILLLDQSPSSRRIIGAGIFCGVAGLFNQTRLVFGIVGFVSFFLWVARSRRPLDGAPRRKAVLFAAAAFATMTAGCAWFLWAAGPANLWFSLVTFPLRYYRVESFNNWRVLLTTARLHMSGTAWLMLLFLYATVPLAYLWFLLFRRHRKFPPETDRALMLMTVAGGILFLSVASAPSWLRMAAASPPALVVLVALLAETRHRRFALWAVAAPAAILLVAFCLTRQVGWHQVLHTPAGSIAVADPKWSEEFDPHSNHLSAGEPFFGNPTLGYVFHMAHPAPVIFVLASDYTRPEQVDAMLRAFTRSQPPAMVIPSAYLSPRAGEASDHLGPFRTYLQENYQRTKTFPSRDELWERKR